MEKIIIISLAVAAVSYTISSTGIFKWLRNLIEKHSKKGELFIHCPYCVSHWVLLFILILGYQPVEVMNSQVISFIVNYFAIICLSGVWLAVLLRAFEPVFKAQLRRELDKLSKEER